MISFACPKCGKKFSVADELAGRSGKCKACGSSMQVPAAGSPSRAKPAAPPPRRKLPMRSRRLMADAKQMTQAFRNSPLIHIRVGPGQPPELYQIEYHVRGLVRGPNDEPLTQDRHVAEIQLTRDYPRQSPKCKMLTPIFHPNIEPATICVGDHWTAGERLVDLVVRIGEMITYQAYNIQSPLDGEAAMWADMNPQVLPVDNRDIRPPDFD